MIDSSVGREGLLSSIKHPQKEAAGDWLATATPIGGACQHMVATTV